VEKLKQHKTRKEKRKKLIFGQVKLGLGWQYL
jgi:hypothetical protein